MQLKRVSVLAAMAVVAGLTSTLGPVASATAADPAPVPLSSSLADFGQMVATPSHLFFTAPSALALGGTKAENQVLVTDLDGGNATPIPNEPGAAAMALSKDGSTLYVARSKDSSIAAIDATAAVPAETAHYALGDGVTPTSVAVIGSTVWFGYAKGTEYGLGSLDLSGATPVVTLTPIVDAGFAPVHLKAFGTSFGTSGLVLADGDHTGSWVRSYDVSSGTPVAGKTVTRAGVSLVALDVTADGLDVVTGWDDNAVEVYDIASMTVYQAYPVPKITDGTMMPTSLAIGADGILAVGVQGGDVHTFAGGELRSFGIGGGVPGGAVAWSSDQSRLYTITADSEGGDNPVLHILTNPELATTRLNATTPATAVPGQQVTVSGTLASGWGAWDAGITVSVSRDGTVLDAAVPVNGDGSYSFTDTLPTAADGTVYHYAVSYAGDAKHAAAQASAQISEPAPLTPLAQISPVGGSQSLTVQADTGSSTDSSTITSRTMDFGDGTGPVDISTPGKTTHTYEFPGTYQVKLTEGDAAGRKASVTYPVTVGLAASARMNLIARDAAGALWQYQGSGISSRVFEPRAEIGPGWNTYKMLTSLAGQRADGTGDLVARDASGVLWLYQGTGNPAAPFKSRVRIGGGWNSYNTLVGAGDLTGDGHADLVARDASGVLWLYQGTGNPAAPFKSRVRIGGGWNSYNTLVGAGDLTGDGHADLVARDASGVLWLYQGTGNPAAPFKSRVRVGGGWNSYNTLVGAGDLTGDGHADLVARDASGVLWLYQGTGNPAAPFKSRVRVGGGWNTYNTLA